MAPPPRRMIVLTRSFPHPPGEEFVWPEARHWSADDRQVTVMPWWAEGDPGDLDGVDLDLALTRRSRRQTLLATVKALASPLLWRDVRWLAARRRLRPATLRAVLVTTRNALLARDALAAWIRAHGRIDVVYSYWFDAWALGALLLKGCGVTAVATRVHGYDLHEQRHPAGFHPLKRQLAQRLDALLPVSESGGRLAVETFGVPAGVVHHAPLGTKLPERPADISPEGELHLLSVASALPVKRIDRLVDAVAILARRRPDLDLHWTHLGGGALLDDLRARVADTPPNLHVAWAGRVSPDAVAENYASGPVDLFINTSESEGVPVSIMEAMAHGVPALAPDVGAIGELVPAQGPGGRLLGPAPTPEQIADAIAELARTCKTSKERAAAVSIVADRYEADANARALMRVLDSL